MACALTSTVQNIEKSTHISSNERRFASLTLICDLEIPYYWFKDRISNPYNITIKQRNGHPAGVLIPSVPHIVSIHYYELSMLRAC